MNIASISVGKQFKVAEFFAGVGLAKIGLERGDFRVVWSNDFDSRKKRVFSAIHGDDHNFDSRDVAELGAKDIPDAEVAWASFPCTDLSQAGQRAGIRGKSSSAYWSFSRILRDMKRRAPQVIVIENVGGFASGNDGKDMQLVLADLREIGYELDLVALDAASFVPQSRPRLFIVGVKRELLEGAAFQGKSASQARPAALRHLLSDALISQAPVSPLPHSGESFTELASRLDALESSAWWDAEDVERALSSLSRVQASRVRGLQESEGLAYRAGYRRMRGGKPTWEFRPDDLAGCLRTPKGGSSVQAVLRVRGGRVDIRWMTASEYAELMGVDSTITAHLSRSDQLWAFGDAVCVPVVEWLAKEYLTPLLNAIRGENTLEIAPVLAS